MLAKKHIEDSNEKFIAIYQAVHKVGQQDAKNFFEVEKFNFLKQVEDSGFQDCDQISILGTFLEVISNGLSFDKSNGHVYLMPRFSQGFKRLGYSYSANGLIYLCTAAGSIDYCTSPVLVFEGDKITVKTINGDTVIEHEQTIPRQSTNIVGGYCFISVKGKKEAFWFDISEVERLKKYSEKQNKGKANALYSSNDGQPDEGFLKTKIVKAALKNYRKKRTLSDNNIDDEVLDDDLPAFQLAETTQSDTDQLDF